MKQQVPNFKKIVHQYIDSTYLKTSEQAQISEEETYENVLKLAIEAIENHFFAVMIRPCYVKKIREVLDNAYTNDVQLGTVISFPGGTYTLSEKLTEAQQAIIDGADELDFVLNYEAYKQGNTALVVEELIACTNWVVEKNKTIKWIIEIAALQEEQIIKLCSLISETITTHFEKKYWEKIFVKSSTGFYKTENNNPNGATIEAIKLMLQYAKPLPVKAAGGVQNKEQAVAYLELGVKRIGTSSALQLIKKREVKSGY